MARLHFLTDLPLAYRLTHSLPQSAFAVEQLPQRRHESAANKCCLVHSIRATKKRPAVDASCHLGARCDLVRAGYGSCAYSCGCCTRRPHTLLLLLLEVAQLPREQHAHGLA